MGFKSFLKAGLRDKEKQPAHLLIGGADAELHRHFKIVRKLGRGSFATVYEAERLSDGRHYALKITDLHALSHLDKVAVVEEIRLLASLDHPNIITYYEAFCDHDQLCVVTELVTGGDLGTYLSKLRANDDFLWERQVWWHFLQAALGVAYLHHSHVLHRDLKPQNIMLTKKGSGAGLVKIVDLGVSAELALVFTNIQIGTPHYMAPEMWNRKAYSYSADIWALGCILHELCTLRPTFLSENERTEEDIKRRVLAGSYDPVPSRYSMDVSRLVRLMLQKDPKERPTIDEILSMPSVRSKFIYLPPELQPLAATYAQSERAKLESSLELPADSRSINCLLPPARYPTGPGVAELMCGRPQRRSLSLSDLRSSGTEGSGGVRDGSPQRPHSPLPGSGGAVAAAAAGGLDLHHAASAGLDGRGGAAPVKREAEGFWYDGGGAAALQRRPSASMNDLALDEGEDPRLRRRSIMVGELLFWLQQEQPDREAAAAGAGAGDGGGEEAGDSRQPGERWRRSSHDMPLPGGPRSASTPPAELSRTSPGPQQQQRPAQITLAGTAAAAEGAATGVPLQGKKQEEGSPDTSLHGGMSPGPSNGGAETAPTAARVADAGAADTEGNERGQPRARSGASVLRRSVAVAEVLHYQESKLKRQLLDQQRKESFSDLTRNLSPLAREPFEFCSQPTKTERLAGRGAANGNGSAHGSSGSSSSSTTAAAGTPARPVSGGPQRSALLAQLTTGASETSSSGLGGRTGGRAAVAAAPADAAIASSASMPTTAAAPQQEQQQQQQQQQQQPEPLKKEEKAKKKKKHGRLWRLMYGDGDASMHQDWF